MPSPKRKAPDSDPVTTRDEIQAKKARLESIPTTDIMPAAPPAPDSLINHADAIAYWSSTEPTVNGVLGGYPQVSRIDLQGSSNFLAKLRRASKNHPPGKKLSRSADCGAGIGRITTGCLAKVCEAVDVVEPVKSFTDKLQPNSNGVGAVLNVGLEDWDPARDSQGPYDLVWNQWCVGQLTDEQFVAYLKRVAKVLSPGGWIVVKENLSNHHLGEDVFDDVDSSVTRTDEKFRQLFGEGGLKVVATELQRGMPKGLYDVRAYALQPV